VVNQIILSFASATTAIGTLTITGAGTFTIQIPIGATQMIIPGPFVPSSGNGILATVAGAISVSGGSVALSGALANAYTDVVVGSSSSDCQGVGTVGMVFRLRPGDDMHLEDGTTEVWIAAAPGSANPCPVSIAATYGVEAVAVVND
jgi:hypothetical protein